MTLLQHGPTTLANDDFQIRGLNLITRSSLRELAFSTETSCNSSNRKTIRRKIKVLVRYNRKHDNSNAHISRIREVG